jgi:hypothetical protein
VLNQEELLMSQGGLRRSFVNWCGAISLLGIGCAPAAPVVNYNGQRLHVRTAAADIKVFASGVPDRGYLEFGAVEVICAQARSGAALEGSAAEDGCPYDRALGLAREQASAAGGDGLFHVAIKAAANGSVASLRAAAFRYSSMGEEFPNLPPSGEKVTTTVAASSPSDAPPAAVAQAAPIPPLPAAQAQPAPAAVPPPGAGVQAAPVVASEPAVALPSLAPAQPSLVAAPVVAPPPPVAAPPPVALPPPTAASLPANIITPPLRLAGPLPRVRKPPLTPEPAVAEAPAPPPSAPPSAVLAMPPTAPEAPRPRVVAPPPPAVPPPTVTLLPAAERLERLRELHEKNLIPAAMYERRRKEILKEMQKGAR